MKAITMTLVTGKIKGLTFIEVLFVVIIIGILTIVSLPNFRKTFNNLQLKSFAQELQASMNYLHQRSVIEGKIIYLNIDDEKKEYFAKIKGNSERLRTYRIPNDIKIETEQKEILFYPDGSIDKVIIKLINLDNQNITLTTKGVFGGVKIQSQ
ncbi:MAG: hypothetical protein FJZ16_05275 [Candidatus Omnitrophica bacterium]|nr:hypothetical protein [Candidatus Omnitrophota bacterium]